MARRLINVPKTEEAILNDEESAEADGGGAAGVPPQPAAYLHAIPIPAPVHEPPDNVPVKTYRVVAAKRVLYDGSQVMLNANKIISEHVYNIDLLRRMGVQLEELG